MNKCLETGLSVSYAYKKGCRCQACENNKIRYTKNESKKAKERYKKWRQNNPQRIAEHQRKYVDKKWISKYGELQVSQKGKCAICNGEPGGMSHGKKRLVVDHDHKTGKIRGLLCGSCNVGIGHFKDNPELLQAAIKYLKENGDV